MRSFANRRLTALAFVSSLVLCGKILGADVQAQSPAAAPQSDGKAREAWRAEMVRLPLPKNGCFTTSYPKAEWREVKCGAPPPYRYVVGDGTDYVAQSSGNYIFCRPRGYSMFSGALRAWPAKAAKSAALRRICPAPRTRPTTSLRYR